LKILIDCHQSQKRGREIESASRPPSGFWMSNDKKLEV
jgi:hypothetical protein